MSMRLLGQVQFTFARKLCEALNRTKVKQKWEESVELRSGLTLICLRDNTIRIEDQLLARPERTRQQAYFETRTPAIFQAQVAITAGRDIIQSRDSACYVPVV